MGGAGLSAIDRLYWLSRRIHWNSPENPPGRVRISGDQPETGSTDIRLSDPWDSRRIRHTDGRIRIQADFVQVGHRDPPDPDLGRMALIADHLERVLDRSILYRTFDPLFLKTDTSE